MHAPMLVLVLLLGWTCGNSGAEQQGIVSIAAAKALARMPVSRPSASRARPSTTGELTVMVERGAVTPARFRLQGPTPVEGPVEDFRYLARNLLPGTYELIPVYAGNITGRPRRLSIRPGKSAAVFFRAERVGALDLTMEPGICSEAREMVVTHVQSSRTANERTSSKTGMAELTLDGTCARVVGGLRPGDYEVKVLNQAGTLASIPVSVKAQVVAAVTISAISVRVSGHVTLSGNPSADIKLEFRPADDWLDVTTVSADSLGMFSARLPEAGEYLVAFTRGAIHLVGQEREITVEGGDNDVDFELTGATLAVMVDGWPYRCLEWPILSCRRPRTASCDSEYSFPGRIGSSTWHCHLTSRASRSSSAQTAPRASGCENASSHSLGGQPCQT